MKRPLFYALFWVVSFYKRDGNDVNMCPVFGNDMSRCSVFMMD